MHSYLRAVGFSKVRSREEIKEIIGDTVRNYDEKIAVEDHPDGIFTEFSRIMDVTAVLQCVVSMTNITVFMWITISRFSEEPELPPRSR